MGRHSAIWHIAQILPIVTAAGWGIACIACAFTVPDIDEYNTSINTSSGSSNTWFSNKRQTSSTYTSSTPITNFSNNANSNQVTFDRHRTWILILWAGTAIAWFSFIVSLLIYIFLLLADRYIRSRANAYSWVRRRKIFVYLTTVLRGLGFIASVALGAYYASTKSTKLAAAAAMGFVFAIACATAAIITLMKKFGPQQAREAEKEWYGQQQQQEQQQGQLGLGRTGDQQQQGTMQGGYPTQYGHGNGADNYGVPAGRR